MPGPHIRAWCASSQTALASAAPQVLLLTSWCLLLAGLQHAEASWFHTRVDSQPQGDLYEQLLKQTAHRYGKQEKMGMVPQERWDKAEFSADPFHQWIISSLTRAPDISRAPPQSQQCAVLINHKYRYIFIRNRKAASTSVAHALNATCKENKNQCLGYMDVEEITEMDKTPEDVWKDYFVFTTSRNPWARAASGYDYILSRWLHNNGTCTHPSFAQFAHDPTILGKLQNMYKCGHEEFWNFYYYHVEPAAQCMMTSDGQPAVDYLMRYEHLHEDFQEVINEINNRKMKWLVDLEVEPLEVIKKSSPVDVPSTDGGSSSSSSGISISLRGSRVSRSSTTEEQPGSDSNTGHLAHYRDCGISCVQDLAEFFKEDIEFFGFKRPGS